MDRETVKQHLLGGGCAYYSVWTFTENYYRCCEDGCCDMDTEGVEDTLDTIENFSEFHWEEVTLD